MRGYGRCRRNHAAARGGFCHDGCQEFMPSEGNHETCAACGCHSCFHCEKYSTITTVDGVPRSLGNAAGQAWDRTHPPPPPPPPQPPQPPLSTVAFAPLPITAVMPISPPPPMHSQVCPASHQSRTNMAMPPPPPMPSMARREELPQVTLEARYRRGVPVRLLGTPERRRRRAKLSEGQKALMRAFAQGLGWRVREQDEADLKRFCAAVGLKRNWFKLWMHKSRPAAVASTSSVGPSNPSDHA